MENKGVDVGTGFPIYIDLCNTGDPPISTSHLNAFRKLH